MMRLSLTTLVGAVAFFVAGETSAADVHRCGNLYSNLPCEGGRVVDASDAATPARRAEARDEVARLQRLGESMARERRADEAAMRPGGAASFGPAKPAVEKVVVATKTKAKARRKPPAGESVDGDFVARVPRVKG